MPQSEITEVIPVCNRVNKNFQKKKRKKWVYSSEVIWSIIEDFTNKCYIFKDI